MLKQAGIEVKPRSGRVAITGWILQPQAYGIKPKIFFIGLNL